MQLDEDDLKRWVGRTVEVRDRVGATAVAQLAATLGRAFAVDAPGAGLPPAWHWILFNAAVPADRLGPDGHPARGGFLPPVPLPRRMWAGGRLVFDRPVAIGTDLVRRSEIRDVTLKRGRTGPLVFVLVAHEITEAGTILLREEHDIVYRDMPPPGAAPVAPDTAPPAPWSRIVTPDPVLLFRYSALTFNGHRIHYDHPYATTVEGYPGLVVHGPLIATLLLDLARRHLEEGRFASFSFKALRPLFDTAPFEVRGAPHAGGARLWAVTPDGATAMEAELALR